MIYLFDMYRNATEDMDAVPLNEGLRQLGRPMLMAVSLSSSSFFDHLPTAWFIYLFIGVGAIVLFVSCFGSIGAATRSGCCLTCFSFLSSSFKAVHSNLQSLIMLLAHRVRAAIGPAEYDSDDEYISGPRQEPAPVTGVPVTGTPDSRPSRNDAWSARMREKYGLDTSDFTYNTNEPNRN